MLSYRATPTWPYHVSCGGAVYRQTEAGREYAILYRDERFGRDARTWHLPKGTLEAGETLEACALREIGEEAGISVEIEAYLGALQESWFSEERQYQIEKASHFFLCRYIAGEGVPQDGEHSSLAWLTPADAMSRLAPGPKREDRVIERAENWLADR